MAAQTASKTGGLWTRLLALLVAVALAVAAFLLWQSNVENRPPEPVAADALIDLGTPEAVTQCLDKRLGEINKLLEEGLMDPDAAELSKARARSLCTARN